MGYISALTYYLLLIMAGRFNIFSQLVISAIRTADIINCKLMLNRRAIHAERPACENNDVQR